MEPAVLYLLDANVLIDANRDYYPIARVPEFRDWLIHVAGRSQVKVPLEIYEELMVKDDALTHWLKNHQQQVLLDEDVRRELVAHVTANGYAEDLDDEEIVKIGRDPFLIAYALADSSSRRVVTTETSRPKETPREPASSRCLRQFSCASLRHVRVLAHAEFHDALGRMTTEPSTSGPTLPWPIDAVVLGEVTWAARTVVELVGEMKGLCCNCGRRRLVT